MAPPPVPDKIPCNNPAEWHGHVKDAMIILDCTETEENWERMARAITQLAAATRGGAYLLEGHFLQGMKTLTRATINCMNSDRTRLSGPAIEFSMTVAKRMGPKFDPLLPHFLPALLKLCTRTNKLYITRAQECIQQIVMWCKLPAIAAHLREAATDKSATLRMSAADAMLNLLQAHLTEEEEGGKMKKGKWVEDVEGLIKTSARDSNPETRKRSRQIFAAYAQLWPERMNQFVSPLTPVTRRYLDVAAVTNAESLQDVDQPYCAPRRDRTVSTTKPAMSSSTPALPAIRPASTMTRVEPSRPMPSTRPVTSHTRSASTSVPRVAPPPLQSTSSSRDNSRPPSRATPTTATFGHSRAVSHTIPVSVSSSRTRVTEESRHVEPTRSAPSSRAASRQRPVEPTLEARTDIDTRAARLPLPPSRTGSSQSNHDDATHQPHPSTSTSSRNHHARSAVREEDVSAPPRSTFAVPTTRPHARAPVDLGPPQLVPFRPRRGGAPLSSPPQSQTAQSPSNDEQETPRSKGPMTTTSIFGLPSLVRLPALKPPPPPPPAAPARPAAVVVPPRSRVVSAGVKHPKSTPLPRSVSSVTVAVPASTSTAPLPPSVRPSSRAAVLSKEKEKNVTAAPPPPPREPRSRNATGMTASQLSKQKPPVHRKPFKPTSKNKVVTVGNVRPVEPVEVEKQTEAQVAVQVPLPASPILAPIEAAEDVPDIDKEIESPVDVPVAPLPETVIALENTHADALEDEDMDLEEDEEAEIAEPHLIVNQEIVDLSSQSDEDATSSKPRLSGVLEGEDDEPPATLDVPTHVETVELSADHDSESQLDAPESQPQPLDEDTSESYASTSLDTVVYQPQLQPQAACAQKDKNIPPQQEMVDEPLTLADLTIIVDSDSDSDDNPTAERHPLPPAETMLEGFELPVEQDENVDSHSEKQFGAAASPARRVLMDKEVNGSDAVTVHTPKLSEVENTVFESS